MGVSLKLENQLCFALYATSRLIIKLYQPFLTEWDITYPQYLVFLLLWEKDKRTVSDIGNCLMLESNTLTPLLKRLETKGFIKRTRSAEDERSVIIELTQTGKDLRKAALKVPAEVAGHLTTDTVSVDDLLSLKDRLNEIAKGIH